MEIVKASELNEIKNDWDKIKNEKNKDDELTIFNEPRKGCKYCYGKGFVGYYANDSKRMPREIAICRCVTNPVSYGNVAPKPMTYALFKGMIAKAKLIYNLEDQDVKETITAPIQGTDQESSQERTEG